MLKWIQIKIDFPSINVDNTITVTTTKVLPLKYNCSLFWLAFTSYIKEVYMLIATYLIKIIVNHPPEK